MLYRTASEGPTWDSLYWHDTPHTVLFGTPDPADPRGLANRRGTGEVFVEGDGTLTMSGSQPRFYLGTSQVHPFKNVEITVYYRRLEDDGTAYAGLVVGARSGADGHSEQPCTATTYYARMRHDGDLDVAKELKHPEAAARAAVPIWNGHELPGGQWLGMKYLVTNTQSNDAVRLRVYWDLTSGENGGKWELLLDELDEGGWGAPHDCDFAPDHVVVDGGGVVFLRNTGLSGQGASYRALSVREVDPSAPCAD